MTQVPDKPTVDGLEAKWSERWESDGVYRFDRTATREQVFSIDTPPPTVSGSLHMGHVFSYTHTDIIARYRRMAGDEAVFYPDGLGRQRPADRAPGAELLRRALRSRRCPYDPELRGSRLTPAQPSAVEERGELAIAVSATSSSCAMCSPPTDEWAFEELWRQLGLSVDWSMTYATIDERCQRVAQRAFLENLERVARRTRSKRRRCGT